MAKLSSLIPALAGVTGMPETTVEAYARRIRQAGKLSSGGRGLGGADMTSRDCANLLIAVMARTPTHAVAALKLFGSMTCGPTPPDHRAEPLHTVLDLKVGHTFAQLIARLIEKAGAAPLKETLEQALRQAGFINPETIDPQFIGANLRIATPWNSGSFSALFRDDPSTPISNNLFLHYLPTSYWPRYRNNREVGLVGDYGRGDLHQETVVTEQTIDALGKLLGET